MDNAGNLILIGFRPTQQVRRVLDLPCGNLATHPEAIRNNPNRFPHRIAIFQHLDSCSLREKKLGSKCPCPFLKDTGRHPTKHLRHWQSALTIRQLPESLPRTNGGDLRRAPENPPLPHPLLLLFPAGPVSGRERERETIYNCSPAEATPPGIRSQQGDNGAPERKRNPTALSAADVMALSKLTQNHTSVESEI